ncbi:MAG: ATP-binding protein [Candidatus Eremiobacteraeota bacterium]|nr:ATP-binding protein [Candidatus Eremiobacteraeota bacterium]MCW5868275.1 ATP-binding protein [Candidatus Eremiobacteraeota bacterium]
METVSRFFQPPAGHFFLFGPRGTGKSTWLRQAFPAALWLDLLSSEHMRRFSAHPERLREVCREVPVGGTVVLDEVQRIPDLLSIVHQLIEDPHIQVRFVLTGSSSRKLKRSGVDLLAGRAILERMHPFMASELGSEFDLHKALELGLLPLVVKAREPAATLRSYASLYLQEEVKAEGLVRNLGDFSRFLEAISFSQASLLNLAEVARECEVNRKTVEGYVDILEDLLLSFRLPVFTRRAKRQLVAHPKFFYFDTGVFRSLRPTGPLDSAAEMGGAALETLVAQHLRAWNDLSGSRHSLSYWRTRSGSEVDFIVYGPAGFWAIEVKHSQNVHSKDLRPLQAFQEDYPEAQCLLLYRGELARQQAGIRILPVDAFLRSLQPDSPLTVQTTKWRSR